MLIVSKRAAITFIFLGSADRKQAVLEFDRLVKYAHVEENEQGYDVNLILVDPHEPILAKDYVVQTWKRRLDFLNSQVRPVGCYIISSNDMVDQPNIIYIYQGEKANFIYDKKSCPNSQ